MPRFTLPACAFAAVLIAGCVAPNDDLEVAAVPAPPGSDKAIGVTVPEIGRLLLEDRTITGSGTLGDWSANTPSVSTAEQFQAVLASNGMLVVGDSVAAATVSALATRVAAEHGLPTAVNTHGGRPTAPAADWIVANAGLIPDRGIVVVSGANDIFAPRDWWRQVDRVLAAAGDRPVYWVSVHVARSRGDAAQRAADRHNSDWVNDQLTALTATRPNLVVVDWAGALAAGGQGADWLADGVHPTAAGVQALCDLIEGAMGL